MSTLSVIGAVINQISTFAGIPTNAGGQPGVYSFDVPPSVDNAQVYPSYIVVIDNGFGSSPAYEFEHTVMEQTNLDVMIYADTLDNASQIAEIVKYNGGVVGRGLGLDFGQLPTLGFQYGNLEIRRINERYFAAQATGKSSQRVHVCQLSYRVSLYRYS